MPAIAVISFRPKRRNLELLVPLDYDDDTEFRPTPMVRENSASICSGNAEVTMSKSTGSSAEQQVTHAAADKKGTETRSL